MSCRLSEVRLANPWIWAPSNTAACRSTSLYDSRMSAPPSVVFRGHHTQLLTSEQGFAIVGSWLD